jgi:hypothetical protein
MPSIIRTARTAESCSGVSRASELTEQPPRYLVRRRLWLCVGGLFSPRLPASRRFSTRLPTTSRKGLATRRVAGMPTAPAARIVRDTWPCRGGAARTRPPGCRRVCGSGCGGAAHLSVSNSRGHLRHTAPRKWAACVTACVPWPRGRTAVRALSPEPHPTQEFGGRAARARACPMRKDVERTPWICHPSTARIRNQKFAAQRDSGAGRADRHAMRTLTAYGRVRGKNVRHDDSVSCPAVWQAPGTWPSTLRRLLVPVRVLRAHGVGTRCRLWRSGMLEHPGLSIGRGGGGRGHAVPVEIRPG